MWLSQPDAFIDSDGPTMLTECKETWQQQVAAYGQVCAIVRHTSTTVPYSCEKISQAPT